MLHTGAYPRYSVKLLTPIFVLNTGSTLTKGRNEIFHKPIEAANTGFSIRQVLTKSEPVAIFRKSVFIFLETFITSPKIFSI
jgi:hypothetical protein